MKTGLVPNLITSLTQHAALAQDAEDAHIHQETISYLAECRSRLQNLGRLVQEGLLPDAMKACTQVEELLAHSPSHLQDTNLLADLKVSNIFLVNSWLIHVAAYVQGVERPNG